jgi:hypothetical protein
MSYHHLTMDERNVIYRMQFQGYRQADGKSGDGIRISGHLADVAVADR